MNRVSLCNARPTELYGIWYSQRFNLFITFFHKAFKKTSKIKYKEYCTSMSFSSMIYL
jgi:hypothetical protein